MGLPVRGQGLGLLAQQEKLSRPREAAITLEAWLQWSERLGREDLVAGLVREDRLYDVGESGADRLRPFPMGGASAGQGARRRV